MLPAGGGDCVAARSRDDDGVGDDGEASGSTGLLPGLKQRAVLDIDSLLRPVFGHAKQGASYGHTKIAGKQVLRKGLSPLVTTISTEDWRAGDRRDPAAGRQGRVRQGRGLDGRRGDPDRPRRRRQRARSWSAATRAYGNAAVVNACVQAGVRFSVVLTKNPAVAAAIARDPRRRLDPGEISGRRRRPGHRRADLRRRGRRDPSSPPSPPTPETRGHRAAGRAPRPRPRQDRRTVPGRGGITRSSPTAPSRPRRPTSPTASTPSSRPSCPMSSTAPWPTCPRASSRPTAHGRSARRSRTTCCAPPAPSPATDTPSPAAPPCAGTSIAVPARLARPQRRPVLHLPAHWPWANQWQQLWTSTADPPAAA